MAAAEAERFTRIHRRTVVQRLMNAALYDAQSQGGSNRQQHLREADAALNKVRFYLRQAHRWQWPSDGQNRHVSAMVAQLGRFLGGRRKVK